MFDVVDQDAMPLRRSGTDAAGLNQASWARLRLTRAQRWVFSLLVVGLAALAILDHRLASAICIGGAIAFSSVHLLLRFTGWIVGVWPSAPPTPIRDDAALPSYSLIVPLYGEANMVRPLLAALEALDYPRDKLDAILAVEADDIATREAVAGAKLPFWVRMLVVPPGRPRTKPRACNHALGQARGDYVVVYDAEDRPEPGQLREAVAAFDAHGPRTVCLQARLVPYNTSDNWVTRLFTLDYCQWFDGMLTGFQRLGLPVPLGGTSNHFRTEALIEAGGWDAYNVTEDADLGIRLYRLGLDVRTINSTTFEEAPVWFDTWVPQRTRWSRGYLQTFLVHVRRPGTLGLPSLGFIGWLFLIDFVGGSILFALVNPIFWVMAAYTSITGAPIMDWAYGPAIGPIAWASFLIGNGLAVLMAALSPFRRGWWRLAPWALLSPIYWAMVSYASYKSVLAFARDPFRWEKTPHGRAKVPDGAGLR